MLFNSVEGINWRRKEINRLLSKGMSNIYLDVRQIFTLKVTTETFLNV